MDIIAELQQLRKSFIYVTCGMQSLGSDEWEFEFIIDYLPKEAWDLKRRATSMKTIESFSHSGGGTYSGAWPTQEEALEKGIEYAKTNLL